ncbi:hypothetical protein [Cellulomonas sp.]|uniref:hypothetical protein n=1 Tax=Cellulomonas sp. TaxID=40001 RepID=UPI001B1611DB|nr:hypothetical protein [Cellulomonas sp.]MBO9556426.1 hypothetical protein [Cellulomonas sp.]
MTQPRWSDDDQLQADLQRALTEAAVDDAVVDAARAAFAWRTVDEELAALTYDSLLDESTSVRGGGGTAELRSLAFESGSVTVELDVSPSRIVGQLVPGRQGVIVLQSPTGEVGRVSSDDAGYFAIAAPTEPLVRVRCTTDLGSVVTDWVRL